MIKAGRGLSYGGLAVLGTVSRFMPLEKAKKATQKLFAKKLAGLKGIPLKMSQILSMSSDKELSESHLEAAEAIDPMSIEEVKSILEREGALPSIFEISEKGISASLGQVHQLKGVENKLLAVKVMYPFAEENMTMDESMLNLLTQTFSTFKQGFSMGEYQKILKEELSLEMDYQREVEMQKRFFEGFSQYENIVIPTPYKKWSTKMTIVSHWEESLSCSEFCKTATHKEKVTATRLFSEFFFHSLFSLKLLHGDPHPGNFGFRRKKGEVQLVVYDYGSCVEVPERHSHALLKIMSITDTGAGDLLPWYKRLGFDSDVLSPLKQALLPFTDLLLEPFLSRGRYDLKQWNRKERAKDILGSHRWNFMTAAPASLLPLMRSLQGLFYYTGLLGTGVFLYPILNRVLKENQSLLKDMSTQNAIGSEEKGDFGSYFMAKVLEIKVFENGKEKVKVDLPRHSIEHLESFMDEDLKQSLKEQKISVEAVIQKSRQAGYKPMSLFELDIGSKKVLIQLK